MEERRGGGKGRYMEQSRKKENKGENVKNVVERRGGKKEYDCRKNIMKDKER